MTTSDEIRLLISRPQNTYAEAKRHAQGIDQCLGFDCASIEEKLFLNGSPPARDRSSNHQLVSAAGSSRQFWIGLNLQALQTPYSEMAQMIRHLQPASGDLWVDLGAGYGRMGIALGFLRPDVQFRGYEYIHERAQEGQRILRKWNLTSTQLFRADLVSDTFELESADVYFIYDFGSKNDIDHILEKLRNLARVRPITVIARGRGIKNWILLQCPWLATINPPEHFENFSIFRS